MSTEPHQIKSRRHVIDFIAAEASRQGYSVANLATLAGYSKNYLTKAAVSGSISVQAAVDFLGTLGFDLVAAPKGDH